MAEFRFSVTADSRRLRRDLGPTAWAVLEDVVLDVTLDDGRLVAGTNVRRLASHLGVSKDAAARALRRLADAGVVLRHDGRHRADGTFATARYELVIDRLDGLELSVDVGGRCGERPDDARPVAGRPKSTSAGRSPRPAQPGLFDLEAVAT